ncbi:NADH-quinone oxidoreductase subunit J [Elusimicrobium posterum]|uniref:NADH-quinone oxidoreductase subunit J n=1 Tax=Elusimicrobium posterum TaxID=3116653 RepID=UPI003C716F91
MTLHLLLLIFLVLTSLLAATSKSFIYAAMWLALVSVTLAGVMFSMNSPWAGVFELSVGAGLITVLFASIASMLGRGSKYGQNERRFMKFLPIALLVFGAVLWIGTYKYAGVLIPAQFDNAGTPMLVGDIIWKLRHADLIGQICIFLAGALMVKVFFAGGKENE